MSCLFPIDCPPSPIPQKTPSSSLTVERIRENSNIPPPPKPYRQPVCFEENDNKNGMLYEGLFIPMGPDDCGFEQFSSEEENKENNQSSQRLLPRMVSATTKKFGRYSNTGVDNHRVFGSIKQQRQQQQKPSSQICRINTSLPQQKQSHYHKKYQNQHNNYPTIFREHNYANYNKSPDAFRPLKSHILPRKLFMEDSDSYSSQGYLVQNSF